jgi:hypothetical protein
MVIQSVQQTLTAILFLIQMEQVQLMLTQVKLLMLVIQQVLKMLLQKRM